MGFYDWKKEKVFNPTPKSLDWDLLCFEGEAVDNAICQGEPLVKEIQAFLTTNCSACPLLSSGGTFCLGKKEDCPGGRVL